MAPRKSTKGGLFPSTSRINKKKNSNLLPYLRCKALGGTYQGKRGISQEMAQPLQNSIVEIVDHENGANISFLPADYEEIMNHVIEEEKESTNRKQFLIDDVEIEGRRITSILHFVKQLREISNHNPQLGCNFVQNIFLVGEIRQGLNSHLRFKCNLCDKDFYIYTDKPSATEMNINTAAVSGIMAIGGGFFNLEELCSVVNVPSMSKATYYKHQEIVSDGLEKAAAVAMEMAVEKEKELAIQAGAVDEDGVPLLTVVADGVWSKRSNKNSYNALSGAAAIVGEKTGEVLYVGVKNKFCSICARAQAKGIDPSQHVCYKNYQGASTGMESEILVEGFKSSMAMYGVKYAVLIADGDCSTYKKILQARPYPNINISKIECRNHLLRCYCNKLKTLANDTRFKLSNRRHLTANILKLRFAVTKAVQYRKVMDAEKNNKIALLKKDIENGIRHVFGDHTECDSYFCNNKNETNLFATLDEPFKIRLEVINRQLSRHSRSLIEDKDSNAVEQFNSIICKFVGGKRINYSSRRSYQSRTHAAVVSFNSKRVHSKLHEALYGREASTLVQQFEERRIKIVEQNTKKRRNCERQLKKRTKHSSRPDKHYGENCQVPDMLENIFEEEKGQFLNSQLAISPEKRLHILRSTEGQRDNDMWEQERQKILTSSNFHKICQCMRGKQPEKRIHKIVAQVMYPGDLSKVAAIKHGIDHEIVAKKQLESQENIQIKDCGLFIDDEINFLGTSPDGLIEDNGVVEIKCPYTAFRKQLTPMEAIKENYVKILKIDKKTNKIIVHTNNAWYYQIQGQLYVTKREYCLLGIWFGINHPMEVIRIEKDVDFFKKNIQQHLIDFYLNHYLKEYIDSRRSRGMFIRGDPREQD